jgi:hypothetical protein
MSIDTSFDGLCTISSTSTQHPYNVESSATCDLSIISHVVPEKDAVVKDISIPVSGTQMIGCFL